MKSLQALCLVAVFVVITTVQSPASSAADFASLYREAIAARDNRDYLSAEKKFRQALELSPANVDVLLYLGLVQAYQKKFLPALETIGQGLASAPNNLDLRMASARIKGWAGRLAEARREAAGIIGSVPENAEAHALAGRLDYYAGDLKTAERRFRRALSTDPSLAAAQEGLADIAKAQKSQAEVSPEPPNKEERPKWRLDTGYSTSRFLRVSRKDWRERYLNLARSIGDSTLSARIERVDRYGQVDTYIRAGLDHRITDGLTGYIKIGTTSSANFLPRRTVEVGGSLRLWDGEDEIGATELMIDLKQKDYATGDVRSVGAGIRQYFFQDRLWLTANRIGGYDVVSSKWHPGWVGRVDLKVFDRLGLFAGTSDSGESELGSTADTLTRFAGLTADVTPRLGVNLSYTRDNRKFSYIRNVFAAGVTIKF